MELTSTCVAEHQSMAARNLSNSAVIWGQMTWEQKKMFVPGQCGSGCISGFCAGCSSCLPPLEVIIGVGVAIGGAGVIGVTVSGIGCCCLIYCICHCANSDRRNSVNDQEAQQGGEPEEIDQTRQPEEQELENSGLEEIDQTQQSEEKAVLTLIRPDEFPMQVQISSTKQEETIAAEQQNNPYDLSSPTGLTGSPNF